MTLETLKNFTTLNTQEKAEAIADLLPQLSKVNGIELLTGVLQLERAAGQIEGIQQVGEKLFGEGKLEQEKAA